MTPKINVLLVDDSRTVLAQLERILGDLDGVAIVGMERNGAAAIRVADESMPDLILMDIVMPDMNGFQATRQIARGADTKHIPVIIVSSKSQETDKVWGQRQGAKGYVTKPVDTRELVSAMQACM